MSSYAQKIYMCQPFISIQGEDEVKVVKNVLLEIEMKCPDQHRIVIFSNLLSHGVDVGIKLQKDIFSRN